MKKMHRSFLEHLYYGDFLISEQIQINDPEYRPTCDKAEEEYHYVRNLLDKKDRKHFEHLLELNSNIDCMESCASFRYGFQFGALLMLELMETRDTLHPCP